VQVGYASGVYRSGPQFADGATPPSTRDGATQPYDGPLIGAHLGDDLQYREFVLGLEFGVEDGDVRGDRAGPYDSYQSCYNAPHSRGPSQVGVLLDCHIRRGVTFDIAPRLGYSVLNDRVLVFVGGGLTESEFKASYLSVIDNIPCAICGPAPSRVVSVTGRQRFVNGALVEVGAEWRVQPDLSVGVAYKFRLYNEPSSMNSQLFGTYDSVANDSLSSDQVGVVLDYHFGQ
jgi:opacity protein-like surface antigen